MPRRTVGGLFFNLLSELSRLIRVRFTIIGSIPSKSRFLTFFLANEKVALHYHLVQHYLTGMSFENLSSLPNQGIEELILFGIDSQPQQERQIAEKY